MQLQGERLIPASVERTWAALNDPETLKACVPGCESLERTADDAFAAVVAVKVGPVSARFKGSLQLTQMNPPTSYTIVFEAQGGAAGFGKGSADVALTAEGASTRLRYDAKANVGGKLAQIGSRLVDAAAAKITEEFFRSFEERLQAEATAAAVPEPVAKEPVAPASTPVIAAQAASPSPPAMPQSAQAKPNKVLWAIIVIAALLVAYWFMR